MAITIPDSVGPLAEWLPVVGNLCDSLIRRWTQRQAEIGENEIKGLKKGGQYIGWLERSLVMLLLLMGQAGGIGFLLAAKSILRFGDIKKAGQRKVAEYVIIGTFLSFGRALLVSALTQQAMRRWLPPEPDVPKIIFTSPLPSP